MGTSAREKRQFTWGLTGGIALLAAGIILAALNIWQYNQLFLQNQDESLLSDAQAVDNSVAAIFDRYCEDLEYVAGRRGFLEAENQWRTTGAAVNLLYRMSENLVAQNEHIQTILAFTGGELFLSTDGAMDYTLLGGGAPVQLCTDADGTPYLAFVYAKEDVTYAALLSAEEFYTQINRTVSPGVDAEILLLDAEARLFIKSVAGGCEVQWLETVDTAQYPDVQQLIVQQAAAESGAAFYRDTDGSRHRMAAIPQSQKSNGLFTIGIVIDYAQAMGPVHGAALALCGCAVLITAGIVLLVALLLRSRSRSLQAEREVEALRQKADTMERLNRQTQELAHHQRLETIGTLTSSIAHEFNNLLTPIMGYSILVLEKLPPDDTDSYDNMLEIYEASRKAKDIISRLSDLSRKNTALTYQYVSPDSLVERVLDVAHPAKPKNVQIQTQLHCAQLWLYGNETQFSQMLLNLIINAFQAMEKAGGTLTITTGATDSTIFFRVADTGPGIPPEIRDKLFEPFYTTKERGKGTGLGLAIVQQVVEEHKGSIALASAPGEGTTFTVEFPIAQAEEA